jgi:uncharacterized protein (TIGR02246 family)
MTRFCMLAGGVALLGFTLGCGTPAPPDTRVADEQAIRAAEAGALKAAVAKDAERLASFYADDGVVFLPGRPRVVGKDAIRKSWGELFAAPGSSLNFQPAKVEVSRSGDLAYCYGSYTMTANDPRGRPLTAKGDYVVVYRKQADGQWKLVADIGNTPLPAPAPAPAKKSPKKRRR